MLYVYDATGAMLREGAGVEYDGRAVAEGAGQYCCCCCGCTSCRGRYAAVVEIEALGTGPGSRLGSSTTGDKRRVAAD